MNVLPVIAVLVGEYFIRFQEEETTESLADLSPAPPPLVVVIFINGQEGRHTQQTQADRPLCEAGGGGAVGGVAEGEGRPSDSRYGQTSLRCPAVQSSSDGMSVEVSPIISVKLDLPELQIMKENKAKPLSNIVRCPEFDN